MVGFAAALGAQAATVAATTRTGLPLAAFGSALAIGIRSQAAWLTIPSLSWMILGNRLQAALHRHRRGIGLRRRVRRVGAPSHCPEWRTGLIGAPCSARGLKI